MTRNALIWLLLALTGPVAAEEPLPAAEAPDVLQLRQAAKEGDPDSKYRLAVIYEQGQYGVAQNYSEAATWYASAAAAGHTNAQRALALMHMNGRGVPQSFEEAQKLFFQASQKNDEVSQYHLGRLLLTGMAGQMSVETAVQWFERSAEAGHQGAQLELGRLYLEGRHVTQDVERGLKWVREAADNGHPPSMQLLASLYEAGDLIPEDPDNAKTYFLRAAEAGLPQAQVWMAGWYERQSPPQYGKAMRFYKDAANQGDGDGHFGVARLNLERLIHTSNSQEGLRHLRAAVGLNHPEAHYTLARMYGNGSLSGGSVKALEHFQQASNLGYAPAMYELAVAYYQGTPPLKRNPTMAAVWWKKAASAGHVESQYAFSLLHLSGTGVAQNAGVAFALANVAAAQGHEDAIKVRDQLLSTLPPDVLRDAQDLSVQLFEQFAANADPSSRSLLK